MKEITITTPNEVGSLAAVAEAIGSVGVNIEAISAYGKDGNAVFRLLTTDVTSATKVLSRIPNVQLSESDILVFKMTNRPGELGKITRKLANQSINLESLYIVGKENEYTEVAIRPALSDFEKTKDVLRIK